MRQPPVQDKASGSWKYLDGGCYAKSETAARGDLNVVVGPTTTQERRGWTNDDKRGQGRASRQAHLAQKSQRPRPAGRDAPDDHRSTAGGACGGHC